MENQQPAEGPEKKSKGFTLFAAKRIVVGALGVLALLWGASYVLSLYESHDPPSAPHAPKIVAEHDAQEEGHSPSADAEHGSATSHAAASHDSEPHGQASGHAAESSHGAAKQDTHAAAKEKDHAPAADDHAAPAKKPHAEPHPDVAKDLAHAPEAHAIDDHGAGEHGGIPVSDVKGVTFVMATMAPLEHELEERFYGWRPNDIIRLTDNVNQFQLGVLEVTRRTVEVLMDSISRTGEVQAFEKDLEKAHNNLAINADDYMLPSAESSYEDALAALGRYKAKLEKGTAAFYSRTDNLIPLLVEFKNLLGSCDDNLAKYHEEDGSEVSWFKADDYFFYAQGVASAMHTILQAVAVDFATVIDSRRGTDVLHHAVNALHHGMVIEPWIILNGDPDGFTANHRANLAAPISHARFYLALLIQTLST